MSSLLSRVPVRFASSRARALERQAQIDRFLRVDHAGEYGANRIYAGQLAVLGKDPKLGPLIQHMWDQGRTLESSLSRLRISVLMSTSLI